MLEGGANDQTLIDGQKLTDFIDYDAEGGDVNRYKLTERVSDGRVVYEFDRVVD